MDTIKKYFPSEFDLAREEPDYSEMKSCDKKPSKVRLVYPNLYVHEGPEGLAKAVKERAGEAEEGFYILAFVKPIRVSETTIVGEVSEEISLDIEVKKICLPDLEMDEFHDADAEAEEEDMEESMIKAAKKAGIKGVELEIGVGGESEDAED